MKKTISIVVALAMVFVMSFSAFATGEESTTVKPTDPAELGVYYAELLNAEGSDPAAVAAEMLDDLIVTEGDEGLYTVEDLPVVLAAFEANSTDATKLAAAAAQIVTGLESLGVIIPDESTTEEDTSEDESLEDDTTVEDDTDFLNTILGILGSVGDMIFGSGDDSGSGSGSGDDSGDDAWGDDSSAGGSDSDDLVADTGDTTVLSVAAVALVAGAALVLTRKKSDDAE